MNAARPQPLAVGPRAAEAGLSLVETVITMVLAVLMLYGLHSTLSMSMKGRVAADKIDQVHGHAMDFANRLRQISFGSAGAGTPSAAQLDELFDDDQDLGTVTLHQLVVQPNQPGWSFQMARNGIVGTWRIKVSRDLDRNGALGGAREGRNDLLGIEIWFGNRLQLHVLRAADPDFTTKDP